MQSNMLSQCESVRLGLSIRLDIIDNDSRTFERSSSSQDRCVMFNGSSLQGQAIRLYFR